MMTRTWTAVFAAAAAAACAGGLAGCTAASSGGATGGAAGAATTGAPGPASAAASATGTGAAGETAAGTASASAAAAGGGPSACTSAQLTVGTKAAGAASGHSGVLITFQNTGSSACVVQGYPGVALAMPGGAAAVNAQRQMNGYLGGDQKDSSPQPVTVAPGQTVSALAEWVDFPTDGSATETSANCVGYGSTGFEVTVPNTTVTDTLPAVGNVCGNFEVHPVIAMVANSNE